MAEDWYRPDDAGWHLDQDSNPEVAEALRHAQEYMAQNPGGSEAYVDALKCLEPVSEAPMSRRQRLAMLFIVSLAHASTDQPAPALEPIDEALDLAVELGAEGAQRDLLLLRASVNRYVLQVPDAVEDLKECLRLLSIYAEHRDLSPTELDARLEAVLHLALAEFYIGHFEPAEQLLQKAATLIPQVPENRLAPSTLAWTRALLLRWQGQYEMALDQAKTAAEGYSEHGAPGMISRIQGVVADIALDLAERAQRSGEDLAARTCFDIAERYVQSAIDIAATANYESSLIMAFVINARLRQLRHEPSDRIDWLLELAELGKEHSDMALTAQAYTQIGREYEAMGDAGAARDSYDKALAVLRESQLTALGVWAQRGLWRLQGEMSAGERP